MAQQEPWSKEARDYTLAGISVAREFTAGGAEFAVVDTTREVFELVKRFGGSEDADGLASLVIGLTRLSDMLLGWIQAEADNKKTLLADIKRKLPDYEEPDTYPTDPSWSTWEGVLRAIEKTVRNSPTVD